MVWNQNPLCVPSKSPVSSSTIAPSRSPRCSATNSENFTFPRKQMPWLSLRSALGNPAARATARRDLFGKPYRGTTSVRCVCEVCEEARLVLARVTGSTSRTFPSSEVRSIAA